MAFHAVLWGVISAGCTVFLISTRNSPAAISHLLRKISTELLVASDDAAVKQTLASVLCDEEFEDLPVLPAPHFDELYGCSPHVNETSKPRVPEPVDRDKPMLIIHSSGTYNFFLYQQLFNVICRDHSLSQTSYSLRACNLNVDAYLM